MHTLQCRNHSYEGQCFRETDLGPDLWMNPLPAVCTFIPDILLKDALGIAFKHTMTTNINGSFCFTSSLTRGPCSAFSPVGGSKPLRRKGPQRNPPFAS